MTHMSSSMPASPSTAPSSISCALSTPASKTPLHLGLAGHIHNRPGLGAQRRTVPSLSIRTADGSCVSILNDCDAADGSAAAAADHKRCLSVPGLTPGSSPPDACPFRAQSTPGAATPRQIPAMLPSLTTLVQAVGLVTSGEASPTRRSVSSGSDFASSAGVRGHPYYRRSPSLAPSGAESAASKPSGKRKYRCAHDGCGKAFTTSGHLARHQRIHTGEKNFSCPFAGCASRFSRQDNMMQHYRTHLSTKSRRNASPRSVMFVDSAQPHAHAHAADSFRKGPSIYAAQVFAGSHPIQHHQQHRPFQPRGPSASGRAPLSGSAMPAPHHSYGLPPMHTLPGPARPAPGAMPKQSPAAAHAGAMAFY
ncbi:hypothetical protein GGH91_001430 [Coemansia sp. RSA 2671]|nr:hypothetical protein GGH91_001430 [Coemansia sp. RSA 2671]KAJ2413290.1 hypothetical protein GGI10_003155 [Coemansia sp. RSA 2530]